MAKVTLKGDPVSTKGDLPKVDSPAPDFTIVKNDLTELTLDEFRGQNVVLNIFPSLDTSVCASSVRKFNKEAGSLENTTVVCVSADLPFAQARFCGAEGLDKVITASTFRDGGDFGEKYGVTITDSPLQGLLTRAIVIVDDGGKVIYNELVPEITQEPNYEAAIQAVK